jgi:flagellar biosynthesis/type III secretory pathway ATPase
VVEKRHVLGHNLGMIDESFTEFAQAGKSGETVPLLADEVTRFAAVCRSVIVGLEEGNAEFLSTGIEKR